MGRAEGVGSSVTAWVLTWVGLAAPGNRASRYPACQLRKPKPAMMKSKNTENPSGENDTLRRFLLFFSDCCVAAIVWIKP